MEKTQKIKDIVAYLEGLEYNVRGICPDLGYKTRAYKFENFSLGTHWFEVEIFGMSYQVGEEMLSEVVDFTWRVLGLESRALEAEIQRLKTEFFDQYASVVLENERLKAGNRKAIDIAISDGEWLKSKLDHFDRLVAAMTSIAIHAGACAQSNGTEQDFRAIYEIATEARDSAPK